MRKGKLAEEFGRVQLLLVQSLQSTHDGRLSYSVIQSQWNKAFPDFVDKIPLEQLLPVVYYNVEEVRFRADQQITNPVSSQAEFWIPEELQAEILTYLQSQGGKSTVQKIRTYFSWTKGSAYQIKYGPLRKVLRAFNSVLFDPDNVILTAWIQGVCPSTPGDPWYETMQMQMQNAGGDDAETKLWQPIIESPFNKLCMEISGLLAASEDGTIPAADAQKLVDKVGVRPREFVNALMPLCVWQHYQGEYDFFSLICF